MQTFPHGAADSMALAETYRRSGDLAGAEAMLSQTIHAFPEFDPAYHALALMAVEAGKLVLAVELIGKAISLNPAAGLYHRNLGELCRRLDRLDEAVLAGRRASELIPQDVDTHFNLGLAFSDCGAWADAVTSYRRALALNPEHGLSWNNLGVALERGGQRTEAEQAYANAVRLNPEHAEAQLNLATLYRQQGRLEEARQCLAMARLSAPGLAEKMRVSVKDRVASVSPPAICMRDTGSVRGCGVFAERDFAVGETIEASPVILLKTPFAAFPAELKTMAFNWGALCGLGSAHALALGYGSLYNHNNPANLRYEADPENLALKFIAVRNIRAGEELTVNYNAAGGGESWGDNNWFERMKITPIISAAA